MQTITSFLLIAFFVTTFSPILNASLGEETTTNYKASFGSCPSRVAGKLTIQLVKEFDKRNSLLDLKKKVVNEGLLEKHFLSSYKVDYEPLSKLLRFSYECPLPLMRVQVYKNNGLDAYDAILVSSGKLFDPTFEVMLRNEGKLEQKLPYLALPLKQMDGKLQTDIATFLSKMDIHFRKDLSELILSEQGELTVILSVLGHSSSIFMGKNLWLMKLEKLEKIISYMESKGKIPVLINLTNVKKPIAKFQK